MIEMIEPSKPPIRIVQVELPYPPMTFLNPNRKNGNHWSFGLAVKRKYRDDCHYATLAGVKSYERHKAFVELLPGGDFPVKVTFIYDGHRPDSDNALAACKAALDGFADALKINDNRFDPLVITRRSIEHMNLPHPCVIVELTCRPSF